MQLATGQFDLSEFRPKQKRLNKISRPTEQSSLRFLFWLEYLYLPGSFLCILQTTCFPIATYACVLNSAGSKRRTTKEKELWVKWAKLVQLPLTRVKKTPQQATIFLRVSVSCFLVRESVQSCFPSLSHVSKLHLGNKHVLYMEFL